jgi:hypothetical protein
MLQLLPFRPKLETQNLKPGPNSKMSPNKTKNPSNPLSPILLPSRPRSPRLHETPEWTKLVSTRRKKSTARGSPIHTAVIYDLRLHVANLFIIKLTFLLRQDRKRPCR